MRKYLLPAAFLIALMLPVAAAAKGPTSATISGPGLNRSLAISGDGEATATALGALTNASGFFAQTFGQSPDPTLAARPSGTLGPRYTAIYGVPGPNKIRSLIVQYIYPYAKPVALTYMRPGQKFWGGRKTHGGWYRASANLKKVLMRAGLPAKAPR
jgi:hypothetical protein